jgi:tetratricopeptide (TPR) repeat protein
VIPLFRSLARRDPRNTTLSRRWLTEALAERSETLMRLGRHTEAVVDLEEILELTKGTRLSELFRAFHALTKARVGDLSALSLRGDEVRKTVKAGAGRAGNAAYGYWMLYYDAACIHAALANLALREQGKPPAERQRMAEPDRERALDLLEKAGATGEFKTIRLDDVRKERLLDPLRSHPRFQLLMMDLAFPDDPFAS